MSEASLTVSKSLFSTSVSPFLPCKQVHWHHFSRFHIYALIEGEGGTQRVALTCTYYHV